MTAPFELYAIRLGHVDRPARDNFLSGPHREGTMRMDFDMWIARRDGRVIAIDSGFSPEAGARRNRTLDRRPRDAARELGIDPASVSDVVVTHLHYDHAGNLGDFPSARIWIQRAEMTYVSSDRMRHPGLNHFFEADDVCEVLRHTFAGRVRQVAGYAELTDGFELHHVGGHTPGLQVARVRTGRGWVVVASDALHYYENLELRNPFPAIVDVPQMLDGYDTVHGLADGPDHIVPGHDPEVMARYDGVGLPDGMVTLHTEPVPAGGCRHPECDAMPNASPRR